MSCFNCARDLHEECTRINLLDNPHLCCCESEPEVIELAEPKKEVGLSAGRKRAAVLYPLKQDQPCEWRGKKNCGGGTHPITGCIDGFQRNRHHGPDKTTTNNNVGNVHRICTSCHNRWHVKNDPGYDYKIASELLHEPTEATEAELALNELEWRTTKRISAKDRLTNDD